MDRRGDVRPGARGSARFVIHTLALMTGLAVGCGPAQSGEGPTTVAAVPAPAGEKDEASDGQPATPTPNGQPATRAPIEEGEMPAGQPEAFAAPPPAPAADALAAEAPAEAAAAPRPLAEEPQMAREQARTVDDLLNGALGGRASPAKKAKRAKPGRIGTIGHGAGGGTGSGYGRGAGALRVKRRAAVRGGSVAASRPRPAAPGRPLAQVQPEHDTENYAHVQDNPFRKVGDTPLSTFSIDVDTASYSNVRRMLNQGTRPPADAVRIEELLNYFSYDYPAPRGEAPFSVNAEVASAPWSPRHRLVHIGLKGLEIDARDVPARNLVFLLDVSGSMRSHDKLPLLKSGMALLARQLRPQDRLTIVAYAGASGLVLPPTRGDAQGTILSALDRLHAGGSTNGGAGIQLAYRMAQEQFIAGGINRVILATDGDFNVGVTGHGELTRLIEDKRKSGVFLTVLGFGRGNLKDSTMETLADKGNGNYAYIDSIHEARKVLVREAGSTLVTIAKDVKLQVEWNPKRVESYRLIGYENRVLAARDFNDDRKDAGEIGAGHTVTALYEVVLRGHGDGRPEVDPLKYQADRALTAAADSGELMTVKIRYKRPDESRSKLISQPVVDRGEVLREASADFRFSAAVAGFGMLLRGSEHRGDASMELVRELASSAIGRDEHGDRRELLQLMAAAERMGIGS